MKRLTAAAVLLLVLSAMSASGAEQVFGKFTAGSHEVFVRVRNNESMRAVDYARRNSHLKGTHVLRRFESLSR